MVMPSKHDALPLVAPVGSVADPRTRALLAAKYVVDPVEWMSPTDESILRDKMVPIDRTALYVEDTTTSSPISSAKSAAPPVRPVASHTTTIAISFSVTQMPSTPSRASAI